MTPNIRQSVRRAIHGHQISVGGTDWHVHAGFHRRRGRSAGRQRSAAGIVAVAFAHGLALMVIVYAWGSISGAHVNPAVTFGVAVAGRMEWAKADRLLDRAVHRRDRGRATCCSGCSTHRTTDLGATIGSLTPHGDSRRRRRESDRARRRADLLSGHRRVRLGRSRPQRQHGRHRHRAGADDGHPGRRRADRRPA